MQKYVRRLTSLTLALLMVFSLVGYQEVSAEDANALGHFYVEGDEDGWSSNDTTITISKDGDYTISKACNCDTVHSSYSIVISGSITVTLTIEDINIENTSGAAMNIDGSAKVTLILEGDNSFVSGTGCAGIQFNNATGSLEITSYTSGTLTAQGGNNGAGIGGGELCHAYNITISGGNITAIGAIDGAGIGGGSQGSGYNITISGGTVTATGERGAGIGSGRSGSGYNITISGGTVKVSSITVTPQNESDEDVYLYTIADVENVQSVTVDGKDFNISSNHSDDNNLYLYLTDAEHEIEIIAGNKIYKAVWNDDSYELQYVKDVETSTEGTTGSSSSGAVIIDTSTK